jgi:hypothetical protein
MKKALITTTLIAVLGLVAFTAIAASGTGSASAAEAAVSGHGTLYARGSGHATAEGDGRVAIKAGGPTQVTICGAEHVEALGDGRRNDAADGGCVTFTGWRGTIIASGDDMTIDMRGEKLSFAAAGEGAAFLQGHGAFHVGHVSGRWTPDGVRVHYQP